VGKDVVLTHIERILFIFVRLTTGRGRTKWLEKMGRRFAFITRKYDLSEERLQVHLKLLL
jgi:hypothetical protein